jgi:hypothetical protein
MSKKSLLSQLPRPMLKKAINVLENALEENERESTQERKGGPKTKESSDQISVVESRNICTMAEIVTWAQTNYPNEDGTCLSIIKEKSDRKDYTHLIYLVWCREDKPLFSDKYKSMAIYCNRLDDELYETFGNNDIITLE